MKRLLLFATLAMLVATPGFAMGALEVSGDVVVSHVDTDAYPQVALEVAPPRLLASSDLAPDAFTITENDAARPTTVSRLPNAGLRLALVLDPSVPAEVFRDVQGAALDFLLRLPIGTRVALVTAGKQARVTLRSTLDLGAVTAGIGDLTPGPGRSIYDGVRRGDAQLRGTAEGRRAVVVFGAGRDTSSSTSLDAIVRQLRSTGTRLYSVELTGSTDDALASVVGDVGGQSIRTGSTELVGAYQRIADVLLNQYRVTYPSTAGGPARVGIRIAAEGTTGASTVSVQPRTPVATAAGGGADDVLTTSDRGGGRALAEPLAAGMTIGIALVAGLVMITLGRAGLRSRSTAGKPT
jgi:hypothetical protein